MRTRPAAALTTVALTGALAAAAALGSGGAASAATTDTTPGYSVTAISVPVTVGPHNDQHCTVDADLYLPDGASASHPVPAILTTNGFGGSKDDANQTAIGKGFVGQGYAVLSYSGLGFGGQAARSSSTTPTGTARRRKPAGRRCLGGGTGIAYTDGGTPAPRTYLARDRHDTKPGDLRPARRHDRRLLRRPDPVRRGRASTRASTRSSR